jgi:hypothetical protein
LHADRGERFGQYCVQAVGSGRVCHRSLVACSRAGGVTNHVIRLPLALRPGVVVVLDLTALSLVATSSGHKSWDR